jgi:predicted negative regulator of RcsB-dependent stress response
MARAALWLLGVCTATPLAAYADAQPENRDLYFGEAIYNARQGRYFEALERLDAELAQHRRLDEPELDSLYRQLKDAEFSVGDFELRYRMHHRAGRAITAVLEGAVDEVVRNDAAYRLALIHFQNGQPEDALHALDRIEGRVPDEIRNEIEFLRANVYMALERPADAVAVLERVQGAAGLAGFADYNLGIALLQEGDRADALHQLDKAGRVAATDQDTLAIRDKSNLVLGTLLYEQGSFGDAALYLDRVRLEGPFSNQALLSSGWASASADNYERALVPWNILSQREVTDRAVQEAILALPYAYAQLQVHGRAALLYGRALDSFTGELKKLDASILSIRDGKFLEALVREEIRQDEDWVIRLRALPETPETYYLMELMASNDFQSALHNYLDLEDLRKKLATWQRSFDAYDDMIGLRRQYYDPLLPDVDQQFRELDSRMRLRLEQHKLLAQRLQGMLVAPRPEFLATTDERVTGERLDELATGLDAQDPAQMALLRRIHRLKGVLTWSLQTEYHERLTQFDRHLTELDEALAVMNAEYEAYVRTRQAATHSYEGYDTPIARLRTRVAEKRATVDMLMARQGHILELIAIDELNARREQLEASLDQARYAIADSYDRAARAQGQIEAPASQQEQEPVEGPTARVRAEGQ